MSYGNRRRNRASVGTAVFCGLVWALGGFPSPGQESDEPKQEKKDEKQEESQKSAARLEWMRALAETIKLCEIKKDEELPVELIKEPVLRFNDAARDDQDGTVWVWGRAGRPTAIMELYAKSFSRGEYVYVFHSLTPGLLTAEAGGDLRWAPNKPGFAPQKFPDAPPPAENAVLRLRQMKELARRFTAHEFWDPNNQRFELRLLTQPVHRYSDVEAGLLDGAVFLIAHGTNPEVVALIEAVKQGTSAPVWQYSLARLGHAELHVHIDERQVWEQPRSERMTRQDPYWLYLGTTLKKDKE